jgi:preprotein translocase subunit SecA
VPDTAAEHVFDATPGEPAQALPTEPVGVAGSPVPSAAPIAAEPERSVHGDAVAAASAHEQVPDPVGSSLPADFGRPEPAERLEYSGPAYDAAPGRTGVTRSTGPGGTGVSTGAPQNRNDDCACGSGKKYKRCHGDPRRAG